MCNWVPMLYSEKKKSVLGAITIKNELKKKKKNQQWAALCAEGRESPETEDEKAKEDRGQAGRLYPVGRGRQ